MMLLTFLLGGTIFFLICYHMLTRFRRSGNNSPPHPPHHVLWGNLAAITKKKAHITLTEWAKTYGDIYTVRILREKVFVLSSTDVIREALVGNGKGMLVSARPPSFRWNYALYDGHNIDMSSNWQYLRKVALKGLKTFGEGNDDSIEKISESSIAEMVAVFEKNAGKSFDPLLDIETVVCNLILAMLTGHKFHHSYKDIHELKAITRIYQECLSPGKGLELDICPLLRFLPNETYKKLQKAVEFSRKYTDKFVQHAKDKRNKFDASGMIDMLLIIEQEGKKNGHPTLSDVNVKAVTFDMIVAGTETTSTSLYVFLLLMLHHPSTQIKLQHEIDRVVGQDRMASIRDKANMPFMEATLLESMRYASILPLNNPHYTVADTTVKGYTIPKGTSVIINLWAVHHDEQYWEDPWMFNPYRFLDDQGHLLPPEHPRLKNFMPFGLGRRICVGERLARRRLFQLATALLQKFTFKPVQGQPLPSADPSDFEDGVAICPSNFKLKVILRRNKNVRFFMGY